MDTKTCSKCGCDKPRSEYHRNGGSKDGLRPLCKACVREYQVANREKFNGYAKKYHGKAIAYVWDYLQTHHCLKCGEHDPSCLDFDHRDPTTKLDTVANLVNKSTILAIKQEMAKCDVLCANCHRKKTAKELGWYASRHLIGADT